MDIVQPSLLSSLLSDFLTISSGILITMQLLLGSLIVGLIFAVFTAIARYNKIAVFLIDRIISLLRGIPLILQLAFVYFVFPSLLHIKLDILTSGIITFGLNTAAYISEILRAGIENVPKGQFEASKTLKISNFRMWKDIILPQVTHNILPAMVNEVIALLKDTALVATIGGMDIMRSAQIVSAEKFTYFLPLCIAGFYYYLLVIIIEFLGKFIRNKVNYT